MLNEEKIKEDALWDGLKGIITNNDELSDTELLYQYSNLWQVEESFRITKHDLKVRPIYHHKPNRGDCNKFCVNTSLPMKLYQI